MTRDEAIAWLKLERKARSEISKGEGILPALDLAIESLSAEQKWITDRKPTEDGRYMVTVEGILCGRIIDLMFYGKPLMPNKEVKGKCWYDSDDEWGDIVYADTEILAWMPLPKPYKGGDDE